MEIKGVGIDLVDVPRMALALRRRGEKLRARVFTAGEQKYCDDKRNAAVHYAARFAAKEAAAKALATGIGKRLAFLDMEVVSTPNGAPKLKFCNSSSLLAQLKIDDVLISITHTDKYAVAHATAISKQ